MVDIEDRQFLIHDTVDRRIQLEPFRLIDRSPRFRNKCISLFVCEPRAIDFVPWRTGQDLPGEPAIRIPAIATGGGFDMKIPLTPLLVEDGSFIEVHGNFEADLT